MGDDARITRADFLARIDVNDDDVLSHQEVEDHVDANNDGAANIDEYLEARRNAIAHGLSSDEARKVMALANSPGSSLRGAEGTSGHNAIPGWASARSRTVAGPSLEERRESFTRVRDSMPASGLRPEAMFEPDALLAGLEGLQRGAPEAGQQVRRELQALLAEFGIVSRDAAHSLPGARDFGVDPKLPWGGAHFRSGRISASQKTFDNALEFLRRRDSQRRPEHSGGLRTLIHEELHGASAVGTDAWRGEGKLLEHVTVEAAAQGILARRFGIPPAQILSPSDIPKRVDDVTLAIVSAAKGSGASISYEAASEVLFRAAIAMRSRAETPAARQAGQVTAQFLEAIEIPEGANNVLFRRSLGRSIRALAQRHP